MILVTGGAGFIGANFVLDWLATCDEPVLNLDKLTYAGNLHNLASLQGDARHVFVQGDIGDTALVDRLLAQHQPRAVINFAAESHVDRSIHGPEDFIQTNVLGTFRLLEAVRHYWQALPAINKEAFKFLHVSTDEVYGTLSATDPAFTEDNTYEPNSPYSASKAASDHLVRAWHHTYGLPVLTTNCSNNYGPLHFPEKLIPLMIVNALAGKNLPVYGDGMTPQGLNNTLFYYKYNVVAPSKLAGSALVVQETLDQVLAIRKAWRFSRGERRVRRLPMLAYDSLQPDTNGMATADVVDSYNGAPDRYEWTLSGKREMLVPYNSYAVHQQGIPYEDILKSKTVNPQLLRYELHRVWVVEANLRKGFSHPYAKRRFYLDEDSWQILAVDVYDKKGALVGLQESHPINYYDAPMFGSTLETIYDFPGNRYFADGLDNNEPMYDFKAKLAPIDFTPQALRREGN